MLIFGGSSNGEHQHRMWRLEFGRNLMLDFLLVASGICDMGRGILMCFI